MLTRFKLRPTMTSVLRSEIVTAVQEFSSNVMQASIKITRHLTKWHLIMRKKYSDRVENLGRPAESGTRRVWSLVRRLHWDISWASEPCSSCHRGSPRRRGYFASTSLSVREWPDDVAHSPRPTAHDSFTYTEWNLTQWKSITVNGWHYYNRFTALCLEVHGWADTRRNIHPLAILIIIQPLSTSSIYHDS